MTVLLTFATALGAGWVIDRLAFNGEFVGMIRDEISISRARRKRPTKAPRTARRGVNAR